MGEIFWAGLHVSHLKFAMVCVHTLQKLWCPISRTCLAAEWLIAVADSLVLLCLIAVLPGESGHLSGMNYMECVLQSVWVLIAYSPSVGLLWLMHGPV